MVFVDEEKEVWGSAEEVARAMLLCVEGGSVDGDELVGGSVLEVGKGHLRVVKIRGDPGPDVSPEKGNGLGISTVRKGVQGEIALRYVCSFLWYFLLW